MKRADRGGRFNFYPAPVCNAPESTVFTPGAADDAEAADPRLTNCFFLAVARSYLYHERGREAPEYEEVNRFILDTFSPVDGVDGSRPVALEEITAFEDAQGARMPVAVTVLLQNEQAEIVPVRQSPRVCRPDHFHTVLLLSYFDHPATACDSSATDNVVGHYGYVRDPEDNFKHRYRYKLSGNVMRTNGEGKLCWNCLTFVHRESSYQEHVSWCHARAGMRVIMPDRGEAVAFDPESKKTELAPFFVAFDFETYGASDGVEPCSCTQRRRLMAEGREAYRRYRATDVSLDRMPAVAREWYEENERLAFLVAAGEMSRAEAEASLAPCPHKVTVVNEQRAFAFSALVVNRAGAVEESRTYFGADAAEVFFDTVLAWGDKYAALLADGGRGKEPWSEERLREMARERGQDPEKCHICGGAFALDKDSPDFQNRRRVVDHCHVTSDFVGLAHSVCNLHRKEQIRIPVLAHNLTGFDGHFILRTLMQVSGRRGSPRAASAAFSAAGIMRREAAGEGRWVRPHKGRAGSRPSSVRRGTFDARS